MKKYIRPVRLAVQVIVFSMLVWGIITDDSILFPILLFSTLIIGNFFCGWFCPFGLAQDIFARVGKLLFKRKYHMPPAIQKYLIFSRYVILLLAVFKLAPEVLVDKAAARYFTDSIQHLLAGDFLPAIATICMFSYLVIALIFERPFCNYLCMYGAIYGLCNIPRLFSIKRDKAICVNCKRCDQVCSMNIAISDRDHVRDVRCINCLECICACPKAGALDYKYVGWKRQRR